MPTPFTLHIRLTHACQAKCTYCSSWKAKSAKPMTPAELSQSLDFVEGLWAKLGINPDFLNIEYVGGEILLIEHSQLAQMVTETRARFAARGIQVRDGAQSNLLGSERRIDALLALFDGRVGTSVDNFTGQRQLFRTDNKGKKYKVFMFHVEQYIDNSHGRVLPAVLTVDHLNVEHLGDEYEIACDQGRDLVLRPVFAGGSSIGELSDIALGEALAPLFDRWIGDCMPIRIEPFAELLRIRCGAVAGSGMCAWQADCASKSMSIEPNGDLYLCQEMADAGEMKLGNTLDGTFDEQAHQLIALRSERLNQGCMDCEYFSVCRGGCLQQSLEGGNGIFGSTKWCLAWKMLYARFDFWIQTLGRDRILARLKNLDDRQ